MAQASKDGIPRGQLPMIVLSVLTSGDKYGLEMITIAQEQTDSAIIIKQPSLYSALKRMEEAGDISSYWEDSAIGGKRHYYSITESGRQKLNEWAELDSSNKVLLNLLSSAEVAQPKTDLSFEANYVSEAVLNDDASLAVVNQTTITKSEENILENKATAEATAATKIQAPNTISDEDNLSDNKLNEQTTPMEKLDETLEHRKQPSATEQTEVELDAKIVDDKNEALQVVTKLPEQLKILEPQKQNNSELTTQTNNELQSKATPIKTPEPNFATKTDKQPQSKPVFVQNNLFHSFSQVSGFEDETIVKTTSVKLPPKQEKQAFNLESELNKLLVKPKSFFDTVVENKQKYVASMSADLPELPTIDSADKPQVIAEVAEDSNAEPFIDLQEKQTAIQRSGFVTERVPTSKFRVQKLQPPIFDIRSPDKLVQGKKTETTPAPTPDVQASNEIDKLEIFFKAKNIAVKKYAKHKADKVSSVFRLNIYMYHIIVALIALTLSAAVFVALALSLKSYYQVTLFEQIFSYVVIGLLSAYLLVNFILMFMRRNQKVMLPRKVCNPKQILALFAIAFAMLFAFFLLLYSFNEDISSMIYKAILSLSIIIVLPFSIFAQKIVNLFAKKRNISNRL